MWLQIYSQVPVVHFKSGDKILTENVNSYINNPSISERDKIDGYIYRYIQFEEIPNIDSQEEIKNSGLKLIEYLPDNTYLVAIPLNYENSRLLEFKARSIVQVDVEDKLDQRFLNQSWPAWADDGDRLKVILKAYKYTTRSTFLNLLQSEGIQFRKEDVHFPFVYSRIAKSEILGIASLPFIQYLDFGPDPGEKEDIGGRTLQRANLIDSDISGGLRYNGEGVNVMVRDDGFIGPHIDFEGRLIDFTGGSGTGTHGDGVAGVMAGSGNLDPTNEGAASGSTIYALNYQSEFTDNTIALHQSDNVVITNSSYSNGCNAGYTATTQRVDQQMVDYPSLMHVFSAGNSNNNNCGYGAGSQWGNITGGHKQGKNVMAVANLFSDGTLVNSSSRGPAHDGRIKPDIAAHGQNQISTDPNNQYQVFGGTSAAAPTMAGSMAQLYHAYRDLNGGTDPNAGFLKAVILNSAHDKGNVGPDFKFGWGRIDASQAYETIVNNLYTSNSVVQGDRNHHNIVVPDNVSEFRVMVYWTDPPGAINTSQALVNDIDIFVRDITNAVHRPWVLDPTPDPVTLDLPASTGIDALNNMEQVVFLNPPPGTYKLKVDGSTIPMGMQEYYVVWTFFYNNYKVVYPNGGEGLVPGETIRIHWDAPSSTTNTFIVDYTDDGSTWTNIATGLSSGTRMLSWTVPSVTTELGKIRVRGGGKNDKSDATFSIMSPPTNLRITSSCKTGATFAWNAVPGADKYNVYKLGDTFMDLITTTTDLSFEFDDLITGETAWFSVQAVTNQGAISRRANAISHFADPSDPNCRNTIAFDKSVSLSEAEAGDNLDYTLTLTSYYDNPITNIAITDILDPSWTYITNSLSCGNITGNTITIEQGTLDPDQSIVCTFSVRSDPFSETEILLSDDIESGTGNWTIDNMTGAGNWQISTTSANSPVTSLFTPNTGTENNTQSIETNTYLLNGPNTELSFFHFYNTESGWDGGMVEISIDNGSSWIDLGPEMTLNGYNGGLGSGSNGEIANRAAFTGSSGGWIETTVDLTGYTGETVKLRFLFGEDDNTNQEGWYLDDVILRNAVYQQNTACVSFDQGPDVCSSISTLMLPCQINCGNCDDGIQNGSETGIDCGGPLCSPCPCTQTGMIAYEDEMIPDPTFERTNSRIEVKGVVSTEDNSQVNLYTGVKFEIFDQFETGQNAVFSVTIEDCENE